MARTKLSRRTMLRGILGGAAVGIGLPLLDIFVNDHGDALAQGGGFPKRFGVFFWGNGMIPTRWTPATTGASWQLSEQLMPLSAVKQHLTLITNMTVKTANSEAHMAGAAGIFSGASPLVTSSGKTFDGPSIDQYIADQPGFGDVTRFRSIETTCDSTLGFTTGTTPPRAIGGHSYTGPNARLDPEFSPHALFTRIFGPSFTAPGETPIIDPTVALRRSVLDVVKDDIGRLRPRLGSSDRIRLDGHLESVRRLEVRLAGLAEPITYAACARPVEPPPDTAFYPFEGRAKMSAYNRAFTDILAMALACDQTRVMSHWFSASVSQVLYPNATSEHHALTHDEPGDQPEVNAIVLKIMDELAYMIDAFSKVQEGAGTLLDSMVLFGTSDCSLGRTHRLDEYPIMLAGNAGGRIRNDYHYRSPGSDNASKVLLAILQSLDIPSASWGKENGLVTDTSSISELLL